MTAELNYVLTVMHVAVTLLANDCSFCSCDDKDLYTHDNQLLVQMSALRTAANASSHQLLMSCYCSDNML